MIHEKEQSRKQTSFYRHQQQLAVSEASQFSIKSKNKELQVRVISYLQMSTMTCIHGKQKNKSFFFYFFFKIESIYPCPVHKKKELLRRMAKPIIPALKRQRQEDTHKFKTLFYLVNSRLSMSTQKGLLSKRGGEEKKGGAQGLGRELNEQSAYLPSIKTAIWFPAHT